ncbi:hypothetical protein O77CONTIG1_03819 [Leptolyngbya sp. O-77]|nr:hypothetical protein O77CONTIG1_03819 [Leptolyngbya sp. O-77]
MYQTFWKYLGISAFDLDMGCVPLLAFGSEKEKLNTELRRWCP